MLLMMSMIKMLFLLATHLVAMIVWPVNQASSQLVLTSSRADVSALATIFNEQHVIESGPLICRHAAQLPRDARLALTIQIAFGWSVRKHSIKLTCNRKAFGLVFKLKDRRG